LLEATGVDRFVPAPKVRSDEIGATTKIKKEVDELKKVVFLLIATLMVLGLCVSGCAPSAPKVVIAICGPMNNVQGVHMWNGALLAEEEINAQNGGQGIDIGGTFYLVDVIKVNTNEIAVPTDAGPAMEAAITTKNAAFVVGGFRTEGVVGMVKVARCTTTPFMICGAATYWLLSGQTPYLLGGKQGTPYIDKFPTDSGDYKYIFRVTPFNDVFLVNNSFLMTVMVGKALETALSLNSTNKLRIAVLAESLSWADAMTESARLILFTVAGLSPPYGFGWNWQKASGGNNGTGVWRVADTANEATMADILGEIMDPDNNPATKDGAHLIFTIMSGPEGVVFGKEMGAVGVPAAVVGINVEGQDPGYWNKTQYQSGPAKYGAEYEITMGTWGPGVNQTGTTAAFLAKYRLNFALDPLYTASSYDACWTLSKALDAVNVFEDPATDPAADQDLVITWLEDTANAQSISTGISAFYQRWDQSTTGAWKSGTTAVWAALCSTQVAYWYNNPPNHVVGYAGSGCNFTMPPYTTHDLVYGPTWVTGLAVQWMQTGTGPAQIGVWPNNTTWLQQNAMSRVVAGINWTNVQYPGIVNPSLSPALITYWTTP